MTPGPACVAGRCHPISPRSMNSQDNLARTAAPMKRMDRARLAPRASPAPATDRTIR